MVQDPANLLIKPQYYIAVLWSNITPTNSKNTKLYTIFAKAFKNLILSINRLSIMGKDCFEIVHSSRVPGNPDGNIKLMWKCLMSKYEPKMTASYIKLKKEFTKIKLEDASVDPEE